MADSIPRLLFVTIKFGLLKTSVLFRITASQAINNPVRYLYLIFNSSGIILPGNQIISSGKE